MRFSKHTARHLALACCVFWNDVKNQEMMVIPTVHKMDVKSENSPKN